MEKQPAVYIMTSKRNGTLYVGVTSSLVGRIWQHKNNLADGFTKKYKVHTLVYFQTCSDMYEAITREKRLKHLGRREKLRLIETENPRWIDLYPTLL